MAQIHLLIICGEASGDLNAANLAKSILAINPDIKISGVGGPLLRAAGVNIYYDIKDLAVIGVFDVLEKLPQFIKLQRLLLQKIKQENFAAIILVDFSGFNLRLAKKINNRVPTIYYISPQVWASRPGRIKTIKKYIHRMIVIFKFEEEFYRSYGLSADFVGHPLLDTVKPSMDKEKFANEFNISRNKTTIALLPGSRTVEIKNILPVMLEISILISKEIKDVQFVIAKSNSVDWEIYNSIIEKTDIDLKIIEDRTYDCLNIADFCLVASGTATLETAIMLKPFVIIYKMPHLNYLFYRPQVKIPFIGIVNIVAKRKIIPEFIQYQARPKKISQYVLKTLKDPSELQRIIRELSGLKSLLGEHNASSRAAKIIVDLLNNGRYNISK